MTDWPFICDILITRNDRTHFVGFGLEKKGAYFLNRCTFIMFILGYDMSYDVVKAVMIARLAH